MDDTIKETSIRPAYRRKLDVGFQSLCSNEPLNPNQEMITNQLRNLKQELTLQTHSYLEVHNKASNMASRAELGKYPMIIGINKRILNYLSYRSIHDIDDNSTVKQPQKKNNRALKEC